MSGTTFDAKLAAAQSEIAARLERLLVTWLTIRLVIVAGLAWFTEALSIGSLRVSLPALRATLHLTPGEVGPLLAVQTFGASSRSFPPGASPTRASLAASWAPTSCRFFCTPRAWR